MAALRKVSQASKKNFTGDEVAAFFLSQTTDIDDQTSDSDSDDDSFYMREDTRTITTLRSKGTQFDRSVHYCYSIVRSLITK
jgi:hypothetical protein